MEFKGYAGEKFNLTPGQLQKAFGPGGVTFDTTDRFGIGSLESSQPNTMQDVINSIILKNANAPTQAEEMKNMIPILKEMGIFQADLADKNAQRKFKQEMLGTAIGALGQGVKTLAQGGSDAFLAFNTQAPYRSEGVINQAIASVPQFQLPAFSLPPQSGTRYLS